MSETPDHPSDIKGYTQKYIPHDGDIIFDCGAFCGTMTYLFSKMVGNNGKVMAFEPEKTAYQDLLKNIARHKLNNVIPLNKAIWWFDGTIHFIDSGTSSTIASLMNSLPKYVRFVNKEYEVECISLESAIKLYGVPNLIKMDIEGAEKEIIENSTDLLKHHDINFAIASYHFVDGKQTRLSLPNYFEKTGYETETGFPEHLTTWAWK